MTPRQLYIFTVVWGQPYLDWMAKGLVKSLSWPRNKASLQNAKWIIWGDLDDTQRIYEMCTNVVPFHHIQLKPKRMDHGQVDMLGCMLDVQRLCILERVPMLMAPPDTIFAEGTIDTLLAYSEQQDTVVVVPHPRVTPDILNDIPNDPPTNAQLVTAALEKYPHKCWTTSQKYMPVSGVNVGGICWEHIGEKLWCGNHRLPTPYMVNWTEEDRKFFSREFEGRNPQMGMFDHEWAHACILGPEEMSSQRQRYIGSADAAFIMEITEEWKNIPTQRMINPDEPDAFHRDLFHNRCNRQYLFSYRGE